MRLTRVVRYEALSGHEIPRGWGFVREYELSVIIAPIPLNVVLRAWHIAYWWALRGGLRRRSYIEHATSKAWERGQENGYHQGYIAGVRHEQAARERELAESLESDE